MVIPALLALLVLALFARMLPKILFRILLVVLIIPLVVGAFAVARNINAARSRLFQPVQPAAQQSAPLPTARPQASPSHHKQR